MKIREIAQYQFGSNTYTICEGNIIHIVTRGSFDTELALEIKDFCLSQARKMDGKCNYVVDLTNCGKNDPAAREVWKEISSDASTNRVATFGMNPVARVIANFVIGTYGGANMRFFKTGKEAIAWIKEGDQG
ncbi:STAS/SEC14 domain-containing protein [Maribellus sediminis]|uniref:STAS/SEC14 domain-containing protein n=1 Tax=Maribellus sediminis TaxID=2696285 RepID=UPI0014309F45|nr:STAS/SEC14 domain-containing protein [Maribellus sediminis]